MKTYLNSSPGPWLSVVCWLVFALAVALLIASAPSIDAVVFGRLGDLRNYSPIPLQRLLDGAPR